MECEIEEIVDFEEAITETHVKKPSLSAEVHVKTIARKSRGFTSTKIVKIPVAVDTEAAKMIFTRPLVGYKRPAPICDMISLAIEDLLNAEKTDDHWKVFNTHFRNVLIYGRVVVMNQFTKNDRNYYKMKIDDGTEAITGVMGISKEAQKEGEMMMLKYLLEITITIMRFSISAENFKKNLQSKKLLIPADTSKDLIESIKVVNHATSKEASKLVTHFPLGPMRQKAIILGNLFMSEKEQGLQLNVIDLSPNDSAELCWKRQLNLLYEREYLKEVT